MSTLKVNGTVVLVAGGGAGAIPVNTGGSPYVLQGGQGSPNGEDGYVKYHDHTGQQTPPSGCWRYTKHSHTDSCPWHECGGYRDVIGHDFMGNDPNTGNSSLHYRCINCGDEGHKTVSHGSELRGWNSRCNKKFHDCYDSPKNKDSRLMCGKTEQTIDDKVDAKPGTCYVADGWQPVDASLSVTGNGNFSIKLAEKQGVFFYNTTLSSPYWNNQLCNLIILDDTVVYYKRR